MLIPWHYGDNVTSSIVLTIVNVAFWRRLRHLRYSELAMRNDAKLPKRTWRITSDVTRNSFRDSRFVIWPILCQQGYKREVTLQVGAIDWKTALIKRPQLKPHCIQSSRVLVPAGTSKSTSRRHGIQAVTRVMAYVVILDNCVLHLACLTHENMPCWDRISQNNLYYCHIIGLLLSGLYSNGGRRQIRQVNGSRSCVNISRPFWSRVESNGFMHWNYPDVEEIYMVRLSNLASMFRMYIWCE
jgi:hypothetical protein